EQRSGANGFYTVTFDYPRGGELKFMVVADGYLPAASPFMAETGWHTNDFELKKGSGPKGVVQTADGQPVEGAQVAAVGVGYLSLGKAEFKNRNGNDPVVVTTDREGRFSLPALLAAPTIVAVHEKGYREISADELSNSERLTLQPWGRIEGFLKV